MSAPTKYESLFKIDGVPILPPMITDEKRKEILRYKELAIALELKLKLEQENKKLLPKLAETPKTSEHNFDQSSVEDEYLKVSSLLQDNFENAKKFEPEIEIVEPNKLLNLNKSDIFIFDIISNTVTIPYNDNIDNEANNNHTGQPKINDFNLERSPIVKNKSTSKTIETKTYPNSERSSSPCKKQCSKGIFSTRTVAQSIRAAVPSIYVKPPTPELESKSAKQKDTNKTAFNKREIRTDNKTPTSAKNVLEKVNTPKSPTKDIRTPKRSTTSPALRDYESSSTPLIRSNSFTLESPSNALLQHMVKELNRDKPKTPEKIKNFEQNSIEKNYFKDKPKTPINNSSSVRPKTAVGLSQKKTERKAISDPKISTLLITNSSMFKNKKSPYEIKLAGGRSKLLKKHKSPIMRTVSGVSIKHRSRHSIKKNESEENTQVNTSTPPNFQSQDILKYEEKQRVKLLELLKKQQEEHRRMQETFELQQKVLLRELADKSSNECALEGEKYSLMSEGMLSNAIFDQTKQQKFLDKQQQDTNLSTRNVRNSLLSQKSPRRRLFSLDDEPTKCRDKPISPEKRKEQAATIINAYTRGYLVRRLFKTKYVQKIVQTIRDTLMFVLELHMETRYDDSEENIKLKARLLQQLTSSCYTLHSTFFQLSPNERMDIIAKDRLYANKGLIMSPHFYSKKLENN